MNIYDETFLQLADTTSPLNDNEAARVYGEKHFAMMTDEGKKLYRWKFGKSQLLTFDADKRTNVIDHEQLILTRQDNNGMFD